MNDGTHRETQTLFVQVQDLAKYFDASKPLLNRLIEREGRQILKAVDGVELRHPEGTDLLARG